MQLGISVSLLRLKSLFELDASYLHAGRLFVYVLALFVDLLSFLLFYYIQGRRMLKSMIQTDNILSNELCLLSRAILPGCTSPNQVSKRQCSRTLPPIRSASTHYGSPYQLGVISRLRHTMDTPDNQQRVKSRHLSTSPHATVCFKYLLQPDLAANFYTLLLSCFDPFSHAHCLRPTCPLTRL